MGIPHEKFDIMIIIQHRFSENNVIFVTSKIISPLKLFHSDAIILTSGTLQKLNQPQRTDSMNKVVFETMDIFGDTVQLLKEQWTNHITVRHPEVTPFLEFTAETIRLPDCVFTSDVESHSKIFYKRGPVGTSYENLFLKVIVRYKDVPAFIVTSYFSRIITGGRLFYG